jgi:hypothetical protein
VELALWEKLLLGAGAILLILVWRPGIRAALEQSRRAEQKDWAGLWLPLGAVVAFVVVLILLARR